MKFMQMRDPIVLSVIALIQIASWFPSPFPQRVLSNIFAFFNYSFSGGRRRSIEKNLLSVFERGLSERLRREIVRRVFYEFWEEKFSLLPTRAAKTKIGKMEIQGLDHLQQALERGRGVILWESNSFGKRALSKQILHGKGFLVQQVHSENHTEGFLNPHPSETWVHHRILKKILERFEKKFVGEIIYLPRSDSLVFTRILLGRLRQNAILCVSEDAHAGQRRIPLKFLNQSMLFSTGMVSLAKISGASILPIICISEGYGEKRLIIEHPISIDKNADREHGLEDSVSQYVTLLESYIRRYPEQYKNWHLLSKAHGH